MTTRHPTRAVAELYHAWLTGLVLTLVTRKSPEAAEAFVFRLFRHQHHEKFLPGLEKLGLAGEPHAVAAAKYHYFSNQLGGVKVEYLEESPVKAWIRYPPPRWIWSGTAICAIPSEVNRAMMRGWHAHNGVTLGNPRLGFVCTKTTVDGQPGLEGYYLEHGRDLAEDERLQFRPEESCPPVDPAGLPALEADAWPAERRHKAYRNYAIEYVRNALPILFELLGPEDASALGRLCALQIGMQLYDEVAAAFGVEGTDADAFAALLASLLEASGDQVRRDGHRVVQQSWRLFAGLDVTPTVRGPWCALLEGLLAVHNRFLRLRCDGERAPFEMTIVGDGPG